jgi:hypothetical protein
LPGKEGSRIAVYFLASLTIKHTMLNKGDSNMVKINGFDATEPIEASPDDVNPNNVEEGTDMGNEQLDEKIAEIGARLDAVEDRLSKLDNAEDDTEPEPSNLSEDDAAIAYLLSGETEEQSVNGLLGNSRRKLGRDIFDDGADELLGRYR